ncbi:MAG: hypothetical protein ACRENI_01180 [Gemmatimonadaceae bacterium]
MTILSPRVRLTGAAFVFVPALLGVSALHGCAPRAEPLRGVPAPSHLPAADLPPEYRELVFDWSFSEGTFGASGEGVARLASPDSVRLDLFIGGGLGGATAWLIGDSVRTPRGAMTADVLPPPPLLWAALGRLAIGAAADTAVRVDGDTLRADIGVTPTWRVTFASDELVRLERVDDGRMMEWVARVPGVSVRYEHETARRSLRMSITRSTVVPAFDEDIWPD